MSGKHCQKLLIVSTCTSAKYRIAKIRRRTALIVHIRTARRLKQHVLFVTVTPDPDSRADAECTWAHEGEVESRNADCGWPLGCTLMYPLLHQSWLATIKSRLNITFLLLIVFQTLSGVGVLNARVCICPHIPLACCSETSDLKKGDPLQKRKQCRTNFRLLGLLRLVPKPQ